MLEKGVFGMSRDDIRLQAVFSAMWYHVKSISHSWTTTRCVIRSLTNKVHHRQQHRLASKIIRDAVSHLGKVVGLDIVVVVGLYVLLHLSIALLRILKGCLLVVT